MASGLLFDLAYATRLLRRAPLFTLVAIGTLALGIGANAVIFTALRAFILQPLPFSEPERLVLFESAHRQSGETARASLPDYQDIAGQSQRLASMGALHIDTFNVRAGREPERVRGSRVTASLLPTLGLTPVAGRGFLPEEDAPGGAPAVVLSHGFWRRRFGGEDVLGRSIVVDGASHTVVGVLPAGVDFPMGFSDIWVSMRADPAGAPRDVRRMIVVARLAPGVSLAEAQAEATALAARLEGAWPGTNRGWTLTLQPLQAFLQRGPRRLLVVLFGTVTFVLLIACANVASLLLARSVVRAREVAVRSAMGATRWRLGRQLLAESLLLALAGGAAGLLLARWGIDAASGSLPAGLLPPNALRVDGTVLLFTLAMSIGTGLAFGLLPAVRLSHTDPGVTLREGGRSQATSWSSARLQSLLTIGEVALAVSLLVGAGVLVTGLARLSSVDPGFRADHVLTAEVSVRSAEARTPETRTAFYERVVDALAAQPGVHAASAVTWPPMTSDTVRRFDVAGLDRDEPVAAGYRVATSRYAEVMRIATRRGRFLSHTDTAAALPIAVVNETMARRTWGDGDPIGQRIALHDAQGGTPRWMTIVGVVADVRHLGPGRDPEPEVFVPLAQDPPETMYLAVRTAGAPGGFVPTLRTTLRGIDPELPLSLVRPMEQVVADFMGAGRFAGRLVAGFAVLALLLSTMGLFGVVSYVVNQRVPEFGVRLALGATGRDLLRLVLRRAFVLTGTGTILGLAGGLAVSQLLRATLLGELRAEPVVFAGVAVILAIVSLAASIVPLRRVLRGNPLLALRA